MPVLPVNSRTPFQATMIVNKSSPMTLLKASYEFTQSVDSWNRPNGSVSGGIIEVTINSDYNIDMLVRWMLEDSSKMSGSIMFTRRDGLSMLRTITFTDAFCVGFKEEYAVEDGNSDMSLSLVISANTIQVNSPLSVYENNWFENSEAAAVAQSSAGMMGGTAATVSSNIESTKRAASNMTGSGSDSTDSITSFRALDDDDI